MPRLKKYKFFFGGKQKMTKSELKHFLKMYHLLIGSVSNKMSETDVIQYGRKKKKKIPTWLLKIEDIFIKITATEENFLVEQIIEKSYRQGESDKWLMSRLPISESGYYRLKREIENKIYELYIVDVA